MKLASLLSVREALGVEAGQDGDNAILAALDAATDDIASRLRTTLERTTARDDFAVEIGQYPAGHLVRLGLLRGFLVGTPTVTAARLPAEFGTNEIDLTATATVDPEKGVVSIAPGGGAGEALGGFRPWWFRVSYTAGFTATDGQHFDAVPDWLALAARLHARVALSAHPMFVQNQSTADARLLQGQLVRILERHARYLPWAETPRAGVVV
ncbi:MAG: hypothetical protein LCH93_07145 [Proteobacteria bacterium]|nr:hypothetical protein [Pseudomonadota bacterium]